MPTERNIEKFVEAVKDRSLSEDLSRAARHHSAANVKDGDRILEEIRKKND